MRRGTNRTTRRSRTPTRWSGSCSTGLPAGALDRTVVMVAADHGESLGEHGERTHGVFVYDVTMRVPWIVVDAGIASGAARPMRWFG